MSYTHRRINKSIPPEGTTDSLSCLPPFVRLPSSSCRESHLRTATDTNYVVNDERRSSSARQPLDNRSYSFETGRRSIQTTPDRQGASAFFTPRSDVQTDSCSCQNEVSMSTQDESTASESSYARRRRYFKYRNCSSLNSRRARQCRLLSFGRRRSRRLRMRRSNNDQADMTVAAPVRADHLVHSATVYKAIKKLEKVDESKRPSELIRRDFISAMKLPDRHILTPGEYWTLKDKWRAKWDRGVHVPVSTLSARELYRCRPLPNVSASRKFDECVKSFTGKGHRADTVLSSAKPTAATDRETALVRCLYDADATDLAWLDYVAELGFDYDKDQFERCVIALEYCCAEEIRQRVSQCLTFDRNVVCDVCRSPEASDGDEMVFCDGCDVCVHQSCYGICRVPQGEWLCGPCSEGLRAGGVPCILCGSCGGALKPVMQESPSTGCSNLRQWCHLCCALWIPETKIGDLQSMEPVIGVDGIPAARWALLCYLCRVRQGACVQCSLPSCRKAFHVTCALQHNLRIDTTNRKTGRLSCTGCRSNAGEHSYGRRSTSSGAMFVAFCEEHSNVRKRHHVLGASNRKSGRGSTPLRRNCKEPALADKLSQSRRRRLTPQKIIKQFYRCVDVCRVAFCLRADMNLVNYTYQYWVIKRKHNQNQPLIEQFPMSNSLDSRLYVSLHDYLGLEINPDKFKISLIILRQQLEVARNLCYMVLKRERLKLEANLLSAARLKLFHKLPLSDWPKGGPTVPGQNLSSCEARSAEPSQLGNRSSKKPSKRPSISLSRHRCRRASATGVRASKRFTTVRDRKLVTRMATESRSDNGRSKRRRSGQGRVLKPLLSITRTAKPRKALKRKAWKK